jgi:hypothetical protein
MSHMYEWHRLRPGKGRAKIFTYYAVTKNTPHIMHIIVCSVQKMVSECVIHTGVNFRSQGKKKEKKKKKKKKTRRPKNLKHIHHMPHTT